MEADPFQGEYLKFVGFGETKNN